LARLNGWAGWLAGWLGWGGPRGKAMVGLGGKIILREGR